jgi:hypothetical protein
MPYEVLHLKVFAHMFHIINLLFQRSDTDNVTTYKLLYKPEIGDDDMTISCKAENPWLNENPMVATKTLKIKCKSVSSLLSLKRNQKKL